MTYITYIDTCTRILWHFRSNTIPL